MSKIYIFLVFFAFDIKAVDTFRKISNKSDGLNVKSSIRERIYLMNLTYMGFNIFVRIFGRLKIEMKVKKIEGGKISIEASSVKREDNLMGEMFKCNSNQVKSLDMIFLHANFSFRLLRDLLDPSKISREYIN